jgi:hypothetical protein
VAAGPDDPDLRDDLGVGDPVDQPSPTPEPTDTPDPQPRPRAVAPDMSAANDYHQTLIFSGMLGLALAAIGLMMIGLRRRRW